CIGVAPLGGARQGFFVGVQRIVKHQVGGAHLTIQQDQVGQAFGAARQRVVVFRGVFDIGQRYLVIQTVVVGAVGYFGGAEANLVRRRATAHVGVRQREVFAEGVLQVSEFFFA